MKLPRFEKRNTCLVRGTADLEDLYTLKNMPVSMYCVNTSSENDVHADMAWSISRGAGCVQLSHLVPLEILYEHEHGSGAVGGMWRDHHIQFCQFVAAQGVHRPLEIGAGHGALAKQFLNNNQDASWVIVDPNLPSWRHDRVSMVAGIFDSTFELPADIASVDAVIHSHTFEHMYAPRAFLEDVSRFLQVGGKHVFSLPRLDLWLERQYSNALNFEHTVLLTEGIIDKLLKLTGFVILEKKYFLADHSIFYATEKASSSQLEGDIGDFCYGINEYVTNRALFLNFITSQQKAVDRINAILASGEEGDIFLFGAHVFTQFLIGFGLNVSKVVCIIDNDVKKHGKRLYGTELMVRGADILKGARQPKVVLRVGAYKEEIVRGITEGVRKDVIFIE